MSLGPLRCAGLTALPAQQVLQSAATVSSALSLMSIQTPPPSPPPRVLCALNFWRLPCCSASYAVQASLPCLPSRSLNLQPSPAQC